jgi:hypothetical protein
MGKKLKNGKRPEGLPPGKDRDSKLEVDETGEPVISDDDPEIIPTPEEELETTPPYEPPPPAEGP